MKLADITSELLRLFAGQDADCGGAIVVWHDPSGEFEDALADLELPGVNVLVDREGGRFAIKRELNGDLGGRKVLIYRRSAGEPSGDWLADVEARCIPFAADYVSVQLREIGAVDSYEMRAAFESHKAFFAKRRNVTKLNKLLHSSGEGVVEAVDKLEIGILAVCFGSGELDPAAIVSSYMALLHEGNAGQAVALLAEYGMDGFFCELIRHWCGFEGNALELSRVPELLVHVLLSACSQSVTGGCLDALSGRFSPQVVHVAFCRACLDYWVRGGNRLLLLSMATAVERELELGKLFAGVGLDCLVGADVFPCIDAAILRMLFERVRMSVDASDEALSIVASRRGSLWYEELACYYRGVSAAAHMQRFYRDHVEGFAGMGALALWGAYTGDLYHMDAWYRELVTEFAGAFRAGEYELDEDFRACFESMEALYKGWFLKELSRRWASASGDALGLQGYVKGIPRQIDFDLSYVEPANRRGKRIWVIVSDALRYEVASELAERLERETKGQCKLSAVQGVFPSITRCGMAALLPHGTMRYKASGEGRSGFNVLVDGERVDTIEARQKVIAGYYEDAVALRYDRFVGEMDRAERREAVGDANVVYIYHDLIDAIGDKAATERRTFHACDETIDELSVLVKLIVREFMSSRIVITADHGFLYTAEPLAEYDHASVADVAGAVVEAGRRWAVATGDSESDTLLKVALPASAGELVGFSPRECVRLRRPGGGENFVHGGISLQELCVPVLTFSNKRAGTRGFVASSPVGLSLVTQLETISNASFFLEFLQDEAVGGKILPANYEVYVADCDGGVVTDNARIVADLTEVAATARRFKVMLTVRPTAELDEHAEYALCLRNAGSGEERVLQSLRFHVYLGSEW